MTTVAMPGALSDIRLGLGPILMDGSEPIDCLLRQIEHQAQKALQNKHPHRLPSAPAGCSCAEQLQAPCKIAPGSAELSYHGVPICHQVSRSCRQLDYYVLQPKHGGVCGFSASLQTLPHPSSTSHASDSADPTAFRLMVMGMRGQAQGLDVTNQTTVWRVKAMVEDRTGRSAAVPTTNMPS